MRVAQRHCDPIRVRLADVRVWVTLRPTPVRKGALCYLRVCRSAGVQVWQADNGRSNWTLFPLAPRNCKAAQEQCLLSRAQVEAERGSTAWPSLLVLDAGSHFTLCLSVADAGPPALGQ